MSNYSRFRISLSDKNINYESKVVEAQLSGGSLCIFNINEDERSLIEEIEGKISQGVPTTISDLRNYGSLLYRKIFIGEGGNIGKVREAFSSNKTWSISKNLSGISINLEIDSSLRQRNWEFLFDEDNEIWLGINEGTPISHFVPGNVIDKQVIDHEIRLLIAIANPIDQVDLVDEEKEINAITETFSELKKSGLIDIEILYESSESNLINKLKDFQPHILHFIGHGSNVNNEPVLFLKSNEGNTSVKYSVDSMRIALGNCKFLRLVVLNACLTSEFAYELARLCNIAAIGMKSRIKDQSAKYFAQGFYIRLAEGEPVDVCANYARQQIWVNYSKDRPDWGLPELYLSNGDADLFTTGKSKTIIDVITKPKLGTLYIESNIETHIYVYSDRDSKWSYLGKTDRDSESGLYQLTSKLDIGQRKIKAEASGFVSKEINIEINENKVTRIRLNFKKTSKIPKSFNFLIWKRISASGLILVSLLLMIFLLYSKGISNWNSNLVKIPGGKFITGGEDDKDLPLLRLMRKYREGIDLEKQIWPEPREIFLDDYFIDQYEVTNAEYKVFLSYINRTNDHRHCHPNEPKNKDHTPAYWNDPNFNRSDQPVVGIDWYDAYAYANWAGKQLPTPEQWEKAGRGTDGFLYPWGNEYRPNLCNDSNSIFMCPIAVDSYPEGRSPFGLFNMTGNVSELTLGESESIQGFKIAMGGSWTDPCEILGLLFKRFNSVAPDARRKDVGFRCVSYQPGKNMIKIPAGKFKSGSESSFTLNLIRSEFAKYGLSVPIPDATITQLFNKFILDRLISHNPKKIDLPTYYISRFEVTNAEYRKFLKETRGKHGPWCHSKEPKDKKDHIPEFWDNPNFNQDDQPVVGVDWYDAYAYVTWAGKKLPSSKQWEKAARGTDGRYYPWGNTFDPTILDENERELSAPLPINKHTKDKSPFGVINMAGNVSEWIDDIDELGLGSFCGSAYSEPVSSITSLTFFCRPGDPTFSSERLGFRYVTDKNPRQNILPFVFLIIILIALFFGSIYWLYKLFKS